MVLAQLGTSIAVGFIGGVLGILIYVVVVKGYRK